VRPGFHESTFEPLASGCPVPLGVQKVSSQVSCKCPASVLQVSCKCPDSVRYVSGDVRWCPTSAMLALHMSGVG